jgi:hypothetical protein
MTYISKQDYSSLPLTWGIIGFGRAARASLKAIHTLGTTHARCLAIASTRDKADLALVDAPHEDIKIYQQWQDLLNHPHIDAVAICSENEKHAEQVRQALLANKHVWVHFPLCFDQYEAQELLQLAHTRGKILHLEVFNLLSDRFHMWQERHQQDPITHWESHFKGGLYRWLLDEVSSNRIVLLSFARLTQAWCLLGPLKVIHASLDLNNDSYQLKVLCTDHLQKTQIRIHESRAISSKRQQNFTIYTQSQDSIGDLHNPQKNLFLLDLQFFYTRYTQNHPAYLSNQDLLGIYQCMHEIQTLLNRNTLT